MFIRTDFDNIPDVNITQFPGPFQPLLEQPAIPPGRGASGRQGAMWASLPTGCSPPTGVACCFRPKTKKPLPDEPEGNIFERELRQLVELQGHAALLPGSGILVKKTLVHSLVYGLDSSLVSCVSRLAITFF